MKKSNLLLVLSLLCLVFSSCKDDDGDKVNPIDIPGDFSELSVEENKKNLEDNGIKMVKELTDLKNTSAIQTSISFTYFLDLADPLAEEAHEGGRIKASSSKYTIIGAVSKFGKRASDTKVIFDAMRATSEDDPETAQEIYDDLVGTYSWNSTEQEWDFVGGSDKIVFKFPSTESGTSNNAIYTIHSYAGITTPSSPLSGDYDGDFPSGLSLDLTVNGNKVMEYGFAASYNNDGEPTSVITTLSLVPFKYEISLTNNSKEIAVKYSLKNNDIVLMDMGIGAKGNFTTDVVENSEDGSDVINTGQAYFQLLDVKLAGDVNVKALIEDSESNEDDVEEMVASFNRNVDLTLFYVEAKTKIADTEFYVDEVVDEYCYCEDDVYEQANIRLVFADDSKMDLDTYAEGSFSDLEADFEALLEALEADLD